jgi:hydrogenase maturation protein HypF
MIRPAPSLSISSPLQRLHLRVQGMVQGVGFRPFVYTLATELGLGGWVRNNDSGVDIEVEGSPSELAAFLERLERDRPSHSILSQLETTWLAPCGYKHFEIYESSSDAPSKSAWILPDLATCSACLEEIFDPRNRRYRYPFTNCTHCGPRYSILTALPYDRPNTTMQQFRMCPDCQQEYENPQDRRFHAQPNACPRCGPHLEFWDNQGKAIAPGSSSSELIVLAADRIQQGEVLALKGLGGFHLIVDARNEEAVQRIRDRKHRPTKPLAVMYPNLEALRGDCIVSPAEEKLLTSAAAPIVLLKQKRSHLALSIAPHQNTLGVMLPYTPLHHLLLAELGFPVVATSGNRSQAPICIDEQAALRDLAAIVDIFLVHDRPIARPVDDSVIRTIEGRPMLLRQARGFAPATLAGMNIILSQSRYSSDPPKSPYALRQATPRKRGTLSEFPPSKGGLGGICILAVGGHFKNTVALSIQDQILVSQHLGDLDQAQTYERFQETIGQFLKLYSAKPVAIACDTHPDYASTHFAQTLSEQLNAPVIPIQHHYAHVLSGIVDNHLDPPVLGIAWDGTGYGLDGTLWGGEFLVIPDRTGFQRMAHLRSFSLPGGDRAAREPRRAALGLLYKAFGEATFELEDCPTSQAFQPQELKLLRTMLQKGVNSPRTSSVGRLFDAIASLTGLCQQSTFEGEAAMQLESALEGICTAETYPYELNQDTPGTWILNWQPMLVSILDDLGKNPNSKSPRIGGFRGRVQSAVEPIQHPLQNPIGEIAAKFHNTLVEMMVAIAHQVGIPQVVLTGGCFQNRYLLERSIQRLREEGFAPHWHHQIPPNDGGLAVGQILGANWVLQNSKEGGTLCV